MFALFITIVLAISISFLCSVFEAVLLSVTPSYIVNLKKAAPQAARRLKQQKEQVESPLIAILTLNTIAHTVGAAVAGAQAAKVFGNDLVGVFSAVLTFLILFFSEIIPKTIGANYWRALAPGVSLVLLWLERLCYPLIWASKNVTRLIGKGDASPYIRQEISAMAKAGVESGELDSQESHILTQMMKARDMSANDIMTPRIVMFTLPAEMSQHTFVQKHRHEPFTRIPVYQGEHDNIIGYINRTDVLLAERYTPDAAIGNVIRQLLVVPDSARILPLFELMTRRKTQIAMVVDEYGSIRGLISLEDIIESLLGHEIVDINDPAIDMQQLARQLWAKRMQDKGIRQSDDDAQPPSP
ncbi:CNNM domain-containing protein [Shewanella sp. YIC-542]|uniref:CNNM domain-containing protein n=1 Tax=Shewanella mytili TaxID=3377111 RepID=UPI00398F44BA